MHESRCYRASAGGFGCISCHDPHRRPAPEERAGYYRGRCLECHGAIAGCRLPEASRRERNPRRRLHRLPHAAAGSERNPACRGDRPSHPPPARRGRPSPLPADAEEPRSADGDRRWSLFHRDLLDTAAGRGRARPGRRPRPLGRRGSAAAALPRLEAAIAARPDDLLACQAKGIVLGQLGRLADGLAAFRAALARDPTPNPPSPAPRTSPTGSGGETRPSPTYGARSPSARGTRSYHANLAALCFDARDWRARSRPAGTALRLNPMDLESRKLLVRALLHAGDRAAREEFRILLDFDPPNRAELLRRFPTLR